MFKGLSSVNGDITDKISIDDRGLAFGDGLFETILVDYQDQSPHIYFLQRHLARLQQGCFTLGFALDFTELENDIYHLFAALNQSKNVPKQLRLKIIISRGSSTSGYRVPNGTVANRILLLSPLAVSTDMMAKEGVKLRSCQWALASQPQLAGLKHLNRLDQVMARREWSDPDIFEGILSDNQGHLIEGTFTNLFVVDEKGIRTPDLSACGVKGIMRQLVIEKLAKTVNVPVRETAFSTIMDAEELFITNSLIGVIPVIAFDQKLFSIGKITKRLQIALQNLRELRHEI
ncbi:MAG: aminodeoxychorismate lyase [Cellvibrionales bacterium]|nr:aminodeoxychorismate lyase [Cellvibrionales bacterium]